MRACVLAEMPGGPQRALKAYQRTAARYPDGFTRLFSQSVLRLLGRKADAAAASLECRKQASKETARAWPLWWQRMLDYNCGSVSADELLVACQDRFAQCVAHYFIALTKLAEGDRPGARAHFRKAIATRYYPSVYYALSRTFLLRLEQDPRWPPWIPVKK
jgi:lipoprotein NlpI